MDFNINVDKLIEETRPIIGLFPGSFKPPHKGHFTIVERAAKICDEFQIIISNNLREGYTPELSYKIWKQYKKLLPENVTIKIATSISPITEIYSIIKDKTQDYIVIFGKGEEDRYNSINENRDKYSNVEIIDAGNYNDISATSLRKAIGKRDLKEIKNLIPKGIKVMDFLLNFQIHEDKIPGGLAQGKSIIDIAKHHRISQADIFNQLNKGIKIEMEHTTSKEIAKEIAMDHLWEDPIYYDKLDKMEHPLNEKINYHNALINMAKRKDPDRLTSLGQEYLPEAKNLGDLYHFTNFSNALNILNSNKMVASSTEASEYQRDFQSLPKEKRQQYRDKGKKNINFISFTRDKNLYRKNPKLSAAPLVRIKFDGNKLSNKYKFSPFNYYSYENETEQDKYTYNEGEERIILDNSDEISNIKNYILKVEIVLDKIEDNETYLKQAEELKNKYPGLVNLIYKEKSITMDDYKTNILPNIEPYRDEEFNEQVLNESIQVDPKRYLELLGILFNDCCKEKGVDKPKISIINNDKYSTQHQSYGGYSPSNKSIKLVIYGRNAKDSLVTLRHELEHYFQDLNGELTNNSGKDGDEIENSANAKAAEFMRGFGRKYPEIYTLKYDKN